MEQTLNYLKQIFGKELSIENNKSCNVFPLYLTERYNCLFIRFPNDEKTYTLMKPIVKQEINIIQLKKQMQQIYKYSETIAVFVFEYLRISQRNSLIQNQIPFVQPDNQVYIPASMICLNKKEIIEKEYDEAFSIAAQVVYIYILLHFIKETNAPRLSEEIPYSKITLNRALAELVSRGLLYTEGKNTRKIYRTIDRKELWEKGKKYLFNPVQKVYYAKSFTHYQSLLLSNETALSRLGTILNPGMTCFYAASMEQIKQLDQNKFIEKYEIVTEDYSVIEQFKYNPRFLSKSNYIDIISLYAQLKDSDDERIQIALEELLEELSL